jgi:hypothetical protein
VTNVEYIQGCIDACHDLESYSHVVPISRLFSLLADLEQLAIVTEQRDKLLNWAKESYELIGFYHGLAGWDEYQHSPEMQRFRAAIAAASQGEAPDA